MPEKWNIGSSWKRWDPHLHAPGTLRNDQFKGDWDGYIKRIESALPAPAALGITDYFTLRGYKEVVRRRKEGALAGVPLVFANVELRLTLETKTKQGINIHLLVSPEQPDHIERMEEKLAKLSFRYDKENYPCTDDGLRRLGHAHGSSKLSDEVALEQGANQFKIELSKLRELYETEPWMQANVLIAVAAANDGLAGLSEDAAFHAQREELGRFAHIVFSSNAKDKAYWCGDHPDFEKNGHKPKPCLHGSDAHSVAEVLQPQLDRRCWIRAEPTFDGLRQTLAEPERRVHIGAEPPEPPSDSEIIRFLRIREAPWLQNSEVELNFGLVTVIGARGSGKTALADLIALAADADEDEPGEASFMKKAGPLLAGIEAEIQWGDGFEQFNKYPRRNTPREPRVRYLSQKFVETLCSPSGSVEPLHDEIEHVVFSAIPEEDRYQCANFTELREVLLAGPQTGQEAERRTISERTLSVANETKLRQSVQNLKAKLQEAERNRKALEEELAKIPVKADAATARSHEEVNKKLVQLKEAIAAEQRREKNLRDLSAEVQRYERELEAGWLRMKDKYSSLLDEKQWNVLRAKVPEPALPSLEALAAAATTMVASLRTSGVPLLADQATPGAPPLAKGLEALEGECTASAAKLGLDKANAQKRVDLNAKIPPAKQREESTRKELEHAEKASERIKEHQVARLAAYEALFSALISEEQALQTLYQPLAERLSKDLRLKKLSFTVERSVDIAAWAARGERLFDLRKQPFSGNGVIAELANAELLTVWSQGSAAQVREAMGAFMEKNIGKAMSALAQDSTPLDVGEWLFSTDHIAVRYAIHYEGLALGNLSPGTRGVVLLTLYLALDQSDRRPLLIDQPEENLDPRSVYDELVPFFRDASRRRQIIMVTHNANLVVNTDSDQVIVTESKRVSPTELPHVTYVAGGLELPEIRSEVCRLLEGGQEAFEKRRQRYSAAKTA